MSGRAEASLVMVQIVWLRWIAQGNQPYLYGITVGKPYYVKPF